MPNRLHNLVVAAAAVLLGACASPPTDRTLGPELTSAQVAVIVTSPDRSEADRKNDARRKPVEMLTFIGVRPGMTVLDVFAGGGYTSELLARAVGPTGIVYGQSAPPPPPVAGVAPRPTSAMRLLDRAKNPAAANINPVQVPFSNPVPADRADRSLDLVTLMFNYHDFGYMGVDRAAMNRAIFAALKPGGLYVIADHAGRPGTGISEANTLHRVEEDFVVSEVEAAGFKLVQRGTFLRNPKDPRDREEPEPPMPKDEFVLKFQRPT